MPKLIATMGLPACGKSTRAMAWVAEDPDNRVRINRDGLRVMTRGGFVGNRGHEDQVTVIQYASIHALLSVGYDVVCDDTNLSSQVMVDLRVLADAAHAEFEEWDMTDVPLELCIERDAARVQEVTPTRPVGERVIRDMHARYLATQLVG